ncbi:hypothetical protein [Pseudoxanthomonas mexicana]|uniref:hypothetical protein n=1 Tax=Pseudoxanthomonas mexicana TaxID=128785 RepID=UPI0028ABC6E1|nr:hypothetical protein [Pseudoxanthomonas mexicana]
MAVRRAKQLSLKVSGPANADLVRVAGGNDTLLATLKVYLSELKDDQALLKKLLENKYGKLTYNERFTHRIGVGRIGEFWNEQPSRDLWSLKFWDVENQGIKLRFVYMYLRRRGWFIVLAVAPRSWNYDPADPLSARIRADYDVYKSKYS